MVVPFSKDIDWAIYQQLIRDGAKLLGNNIMLDFVIQILVSNANLGLLTLVSSL